MDADDAACEVYGGDEDEATLLDEITRLETRAAAEDGSAEALIALSNALLRASKLFAKQGRSHESAMYQLRSSETLSRAAELDERLVFERALSGTKCTFQVAPHPNASFRVIDDYDNEKREKRSKGEKGDGMDVSNEGDDEEEEDEDEEESSEDEDGEFDQEEYFYQMAKKQYEEELRQNPSNEKVRRRLAEIMKEHGDDDMEASLSKRRKRFDH